MLSLFNSLKIQEVVDPNNPSRSSFIFQDLPRGMGITLGNFLRRILIDYSSGIAPLAVEISDRNGPVKSIFSSLEGVDLTTPYLIVKLKELILVEKESSREGLFSLQINLENKTKKEKTITAVDFGTVDQVEIKNPELELAVLAPGGKLEIKLYCQENWGYHETQGDDKEQERIKELIKGYFPNVKEDNILVLDTNYSSLKEGQVSFHYEYNNIQKKEKLTLDIQSKGWISPRKALDQALEKIKISLLNFTVNDKKAKAKKSTKTVGEVEKE